MLYLTELVNGSMGLQHNVTYVMLHIQALEGLKHGIECSVQHLLQPHELVRMNSLIITLQYTCGVSLNWFELDPKCDHHLFNIVASSLSDVNCI